MILKSPRFVPIEANVTKFRANGDIPGTLLVVRPKENLSDFELIRE